MGAIGGVGQPLWCLENFSLAEVLTDIEHAALVRAMGAKNYQAGETILAIGDRNQTIYKLHLGRVRVGRLSEEGRRLTLAILGPGCLFGEMAFAEDGPSRWAVEAIEGCVVCHVGKIELLHLAERNPRLSLKIVKSVGDRTLELENKLEDLLIRTVKGRLAHTLLRLGEQHGRVTGAEGAVQLVPALTHQDLSKLVAASREATSVAIGELRQAGLLETPDGTIILRDKTALRAVR